MKMKMGTAIDNVEYKDEFNTVAVTIQPMPGVNVQVEFPNTEETANIAADIDGFQVTVNVTKLLEENILEMDKEAKYYNNQERDANTGGQKITEVKITNMCVL